MKRSNLTMMVLLIAGFLLTGIGAGVAFGEYSGFQYGGEKQIGTEDKIEKIVLEHEIITGKKEKKTIVTSYIGDLSEKVQIKEDKKVPEGMVQYVVEYNPKYVSPSLEYERYYQESKEETEEESYVYEEEEEYKDYEGLLYLFNQGTFDETELFFQCKDEFLKDLKNKKWCTYRYAQWKKVTIKVNPKTRKYIEERI